MEDLRCQNCRAPLDRTAKEEETRIYCFVCLDLFRTIARSPYLEAVQRDWQNEQKQNRNRMGLDS